MPTKAPKLTTSIAVDGEGAESFDQALLSGIAKVYGRRRSARSARFPPTKWRLLMFTRAQRLVPRAFMHCPQHVLACNIALAGRFVSRMRTITDAEY